MFQKTYGAVEMQALGIYWELLQASELHSVREIGGNFESLPGDRRELIEELINWGNEYGQEIRVREINSEIIKVELDTGDAPCQGDPY